MDGWNTSFLLGRPIFRCYVSFREGTWLFGAPIFSGELAVSFRVPGRFGHTMPHPATRPERFFLADLGHTALLFFLGAVALLERLFLEVVCIKVRGILHMPYVKNNKTNIIRS